MTAISAMSDINEDVAPNPSLQSPSAHTLLHYIQCAQCLRPLRAPLRLPCGNTLCRACLPPIQPRIGITYPAGEGRKKGFRCPWGPWGEEEEGDECAGEHCLGDCGVDVLMGKLGEVFEEVVDEESHEGREGGLREVYGLMKEGRLGYNASGYEMGNVSRGQLTRLKETIRNELDCQLCYSLILDPLTTPCGHTFCRKCVALVMNHSDLCPVCRRKLNMPSRIQSEPMNKRVASLMETILPDQLESRREAMDQDDADLAQQQTIPLFVSSVAFPTMPIFLHIFEPRYRIMIRRIMESREHKFGMVAYNRARRRQGGLGRTQFMQYGTLMLVDRFEPLPDGRSLIIATGVSRFRITKSDMLDGYHVGQVERLNDVSITEEERYEAAETVIPDASVEVPPTEESSTDSPRPQPVETMPTQQLFDLALDFVRKQHREGAPWLHPRALLAYGNEPTDPDRFPWWFACILHVSEEDKYTVLSTTSVRERLKITARWVRKLEAREW